MTVVPTGTVSLSGSIPKYSTPLRLAAPSSTVLSGALAFLSFLAALTALATCLATALASALFDGIDAPRRLTRTLAFMPGCTLQKYVNVPAFGKRTLKGFGRFASGRPEFTAFAPV